MALNVINKHVSDQDTRDCLGTLFNVMFRSVHLLLDNSDPVLATADHNTVLVTLLVDLPCNPVWQKHASRGTVHLQGFANHMKLMASVMDSAGKQNTDMLAGVLFHDMLNTFLRLALEVLDAKTSTALALELYVTYGIVT